MGPDARANGQWASGCTTVVAHTEVATGSGNRRAAAAVANSAAQLTAYAAAVARDEIALTSSSSASSSSPPLLPREHDSGGAACGQEPLLLPLRNTSDKIASPPFYALADR